MAREETTKKGYLAILLWYAVNISTVILNKWLFTKLDFHFPLSLTLCHMSMCLFLSFLIIDVFHLWPRTIVSNADKMSKIAPLGAIFILNIVLGNFSLDYVPVSFMQTVKSSVPAFTYVMQTGFGFSAFDGEVAAALVPIVFGVMLATWTEVNFNAMGFSCAIIASVTTAIQSIASGMLLQGSLKMDAVNLVRNLSPVAIVLMTPFVWVYEWPQVVAEWETLVTTELCVLLIISSIVAFVLNFAVFFAIQETSTLTFTVAGNLKVVFVIVISVTIFQNEVTLVNAFGILTTIAGCWWYNGLKFRKSQAKVLRKVSV